MINDLNTAALTPRLHRIAVSAIFFMYGLCFASWASRIPTIQQNLHLTDTVLGIVLIALPVGLMISLPFSGWFIAKTSSRKIVITAAFAYVFTLVTLGLAENIFQLVAGLFLFGLTGNMLNIAINTQAIGVEALYKRPIMASFHGLWSLAGFTGAAIGTFMIGFKFEPYQHFLIILFIVIIIIILSQRFLLTEDVNSKKGQPIFVRPDKSLINLGIIAFCSMICEGAMFDWSGVYFKKVVLAEGAWIGAGYTSFMFTMTLGRFIADWLTGYFGLKRILQLSGVLTASGLMIAVIFPSMVTAVIGFLFVGLGVSSVVPLVYSVAGRSKVLSPGVALAAVSTIGFLGFLSGPPLIGLVAGATSLRISFMIIAAMGLCISIVAGNSKNI
ncbi:MAG: MFS transporter [Sphingobacteriaceae bacterium]